MSLVLLLSGRQRWASAEHVVLSISAFLLSPFYSALSQSVFFWNDTERLACPCASVDTHQSRSAVKFYVAQFQRCDASFSLFLLKKTFVHSCGQLGTCLAVDLLWLQMMRLLPNVSNRLRYEWLRRIEPWLRLGQRWRQQNKIAVVSSLLPMCLPVVRAKERANRKIHRVSSVAEAIISGDSVLNDIRKDLAKEAKMDLERFIWELLGVLILNCLRQWCFKRMLS